MEFKFIECSDNNEVGDVQIYLNKTIREYI